MYRFSFNLNNNDIFLSSLNFMKSKKTIFFDIIFTGAAIIALIYTVFSKSFFGLSLFYKCLLIFSALLFPIVQPLLLYIKSISRAIKIKNFEINMLFEDEYIELSSNEETIKLKYENIYDFIKYKNMIVIMYDSIHGQIMPNRIFNNNKDKFFDDICVKIKNAREKFKEK